MGPETPNEWPEERIDNLKENVEGMREEHAGIAGAFESMDQDAPLSDMPAEDKAKADKHLEAFTEMFENAIAEMPGEGYFEQLNNLTVILDNLTKIEKEFEQEDPDKTITVEDIEQAGQPLPSVWTEQWSQEDWDKGNEKTNQILDQMPGETVSDKLKAMNDLIEGFKKIDRTIDEEDTQGERAA